MPLKYATFNKFNFKIQKVKSPESKWRRPYPPHLKGGEDDLPIQGNLGKGWHNYPFLTPLFFETLASLAYIYTRKRLFAKLFAKLF